MDVTLVEGQHCCRKGVGCCIVTGEGCTVGGVHWMNAVPSKVLSCT